MSISNNDISDCLKKLKTEKQIVKILKSQIEKLNAELEKKYKKKGQKGELGRLYRHRMSADQMVARALAENKNMRKKKRAIHKYNQKLAAEEDAAYAAEEEARLATASEGLRDFFERHRFHDAGAGAGAESVPEDTRKKREGELMWEKAIRQITKTRRSPPSLKGGRRRTRRRRRRRKRRRSRRRRKRRTRR